MKIARLPVVVESHQDLDYSDPWVDPSDSTKARTVQDVFTLPQQKLILKLLATGRITPVSFYVYKAQSFQEFPMYGEWDKLFSVAVYAIDKPGKRRPLIAKVLKHTLSGGGYLEYGALENPSEWIKEEDLKVLKGQKGESVREIKGIEVTLRILS